ncbi:MAG: DUF4476 domain-containing protein [bacterium]
MKTFFTVLFCCLNILVISQESKTGHKSVNLSFLNPYDENGVPIDFPAKKEVIDLLLLAEFDSLFAEGKKIDNDFFNNNPINVIELTEEAEIWIHFLFETSEQKNSFGFYIYDLCNPPQSFDKIKLHTIIFPQVLANENILFSGNRVRLGLFPKNTGIGWFIIEDGWENGFIKNNQDILYSDYRLNPDTDERNRHYSIKIPDERRNKIILGFEEKKNNVFSDNDFNDVVFAIEIFPYNAVRRDSILEANSLSRLLEKKHQPPVENLIIHKDSIKVDSLNKSIPLPVSKEITIDSMSIDSSLLMENKNKLVEKDIDKSEDNFMLEYLICSENGIKFRYFNKIKATMQAEPDEWNKLIIMKQFFRYKQLTVQQVIEILNLYNNDNTRLEAAQYLFEITCEQEKFGDVKKTLSPSYSKKLSSFLISKGIINEQEVNDEDLHTQEKEIEEEPLDLCTESYFNDRQMRKFVNMIRGCTFPREKFYILERETEDRCLNTSQVILLVKLFTSEINRLNVAMYLYNHTVDKENFLLVNETMEWESSRIELINFYKKQKGETINQTVE